MFKYFISLLVFFSFGLQAKEELFIYNWSDYIAEDTIENFENDLKYFERIFLPNTC